MNKKDTLTKILAIAGTILVWFPILMPFLFSFLRWFRVGEFRFDYLMPAELFPLALSGAGLLLWAAIRSRSNRRLIGWGLGIAAGLLIGGQILAVVTGLASGETEPAGWAWTVVLATLAAYSLTVVAIGIGGVRLLSSLFHSAGSSTIVP